MSGYLSKTIVSVIQQAQVFSAVDYCVGDCEYVEKAFAGSDSRRNDTSSFLYRKIRQSDVIALELHRKGRKVADLNSNTYGNYYASFALQPLYVGFIVDWGLVFDAFTGGEYQIVAKKTILGQSITETSRKFYLNSYDDESANNTVRVDLTIDGNIIADEFDYTGLIEGGWREQYRIPARIQKDAEFVEDSYQTSDRKVLNVQPSSNPSFVVLTELIPAFISDMLSDKAMLSDSVKLTNYDLKNPRQFNDFEVQPLSVERVETADKQEIYQVTFNRKYQNILRTF